jgi:hypothetical protein
MAGLRLEDFSDAVGATWDVDAGGGAVPLRLEVAQPLPRSIRAEGSFRLEWKGPAEPLLPQAIYRFVRGDAAHDIFIVPVGRTADGGLLYESIFN